MFADRLLAGKLQCLPEVAGSCHMGQSWSSEHSDRAVGGPVYYKRFRLDDLNDPSQLNSMTTFAHIGLSLLQGSLFPHGKACSPPAAAPSASIGSSPWAVLGSPGTASTVVTGQVLPRAKGSYCYHTQLFSTWKGEPMYSIGRK